MQRTARLGLNVPPDTPAAPGEPVARGPATLHGPNVRDADVDAAMRLAVAVVRELAEAEPGALRDPASGVMEVSPNALEAAVENHVAAALAAARREGERAGLERAAKEAERVQRAAEGACRTAAREKDFALGEQRAWAAQGAEDAAAAIRALAVSAGPKLVRAWCAMSPEGKLCPDLGCPPEAWPEQSARRLLTDDQPGWRVVLVTVTPDE